MGGVCAQQSVLVYALKAIETEEAVLLRIVPDGPIGEDPGNRAGGRGRRGCRDRPEPLPVRRRDRDLPRAGPPRAARPRRRRHADRRRGGRARRRARPRHGRPSPAADTEPAAGDLAVVVAAHGRDELHTLRRALEVGVPYVGLVASHKRGAGVLADLRADGVPDAHLEQIDVPAGIDIGARTPGGDRALDPRDGGRDASRTSGLPRPGTPASPSPRPRQRSRSTRSAG